MPYRYALDRPDYSDLASGKVLLAAPGHPAFPVRLASEIFRRGMAIREACGQTGRISLYDPCCGAAYHLAVLGFLHGESIRAITASDIDPEVIPLAGKNLGLLTEAGIDRRREELAAMHRKFGKPSHAEALAAAGRLRMVIAGRGASEPIEVRVFAADALADPGASRFPAEARADIVFTDVPYGLHSQWQSPAGNPPNPGWLMLENLRARLHPAGIVAIVSDKQQKIAHDGYERIERFQIGKRAAVLWKLKL
jgi:23S rRNA (guanine2535-N1)-methyltransferase